MNTEKNKIKALGRRIRKGGEAISISLEELAKKAKLSLDYICEIEKGERAPSFQALSRISRVLKIPLDKLVLGEAFFLPPMHKELGGVRKRCGTMFF